MITDDELHYLKELVKGLMQLYKTCETQEEKDFFKEELIKKLSQ